MPEKFLTEDQTHQPLLLSQILTAKLMLTTFTFIKKKAELSFKKKVSHISDGLSSKLNRRERKSCIYH